MPRDASSSSSSSSEDEDSGPETHVDPEPPGAAGAAESETSRFPCPADYVSFPYRHCSPTGNSSSELWLIKAPARFDPRCFSGVQLPLCGLQTLRVPSSEGAVLTYNVLSSTHRSPELRLLTSPKNGCQLASPFAGLLSISQNYSERHGPDPALHVVPAVPPPSLPPGLKPRFQHMTFKSVVPLPKGVARRKRRSEKKIKTEPEKKIKTEPEKKIKTEPEEERVQAEPQTLTSYRKTEIQIKIETKIEAETEVETETELKMEIKAEPLDLAYGEQAERRRKKKKKKSRSND